MLLAVAAPVEAADTLKKHRAIRAKSGDVPEMDAAAPVGTRVASKMAYYTDDDDLTVVTPIISVQQKIFDASSISLEYDADILSAATVDVRTAATDKFEEVRHGLSLAGTHRVIPWEADFSAAVSYSREYDYESVTLGGGFAKELLHKNLTLGAGYSYVSNRVGRSRTSFDSFEEHLDIHALSASVTQLLSKSAYVQLSGSMIMARGYQASVYRYVPLFLQDSVQQNQVNEDSLMDGTIHPLSRSLERLPRARTRGAAVVRLNKRFASRTTIAADYRFYLDDWALRSHTASVKIYQPLGSHVILRLRNRFYIQDGADFYRSVYFVADAQSAPEFYTIDRELGTYWYDLVGLKVALKVGGGGLFESVEFDLKADLQYTSYSDFVYLPERTAVIVGGGITVEL